MSRLQRLAILVMLPAVVAHEYTHAAAALPYGSVERVTLFPPRAHLRYPAGTPRLAIRLANLAPTVVGVVVGLPLLGWVLTTWTVPVPVFAYLLAQWAIYTLPVSDADRNPFATVS